MIAINEGGNRRVDEDGADSHVSSDFLRGVV